MKFHTFLLLAILLICSTQSKAMAEINFNAIDGYVTARMRSARIPGLALAVVKGDQIIYAKGYGHANPSNDLVTPQTPFMIGSVSKPITALAVMQLVEAGKIKLDAPVQNYISWFRIGDPKMSAKITVRQLLKQTSGIPQPQELLTLSENDNKALEHTVRYLAKLKLIAEPGKAFTYSNGNYNTLGFIVQEISGQSYEEFVTQHIFIPLEMHNSFVSQDEAIQHGMAMGHRWWFGFPVAVTLPFVRAVLPSGYIISSAEDMGHYIIAQMNGGRYKNISVLSPQGISMMHTEAIRNPYGCGWESIKANGRILINHDGGVPNFQASVFFDPEKRVGVFVAANIDSALDTFSSPHGTSAIDGSTVRAMAHSVLNLVSNQRLPDQGQGNKRLYIIFDLILFVLTILLFISLIRIPFRYKNRHGSNIGKIAVLHFVWPILVLYAAVRVPEWKVFVMMYEPDLGYWLIAVASIVLIKGVVEVVLTLRCNREHELRLHRS